MSFTWKTTKHHWEYFKDINKRLIYVHRLKIIYCQVFFTWSIDLKKTPTEIIAVFFNTDQNLYENANDQR